jgi:hypothetical protein
MTSPNCCIACAGRLTGARPASCPLAKANENDNARLNTENSAHSGKAAAVPLVVIGYLPQSVVDQVAAAGTAPG